MAPNKTNSSLEKEREMARKFDKNKPLEKLWSIMQENILKLNTAKQKLNLKKGDPASIKKPRHE